MKLTRRKTLAGIGIGALAGGAVFGSGAFSQTEVSREYGLSIVPDDDGQLGLEATGHTDAVTDDDGVVEIDIEEINSQGDTVFGDLDGNATGDEEGAFTITNNNQTGESIWVYVPRALNIDDDDGELSTVSDTQQESVEFLVKDDEDDLLDISLPPEYPETTEAFDGANVDNPDRAGASSLPKTTNTGAVEIDAGDSVDVELRVLVDGIRDETQEFSKVYRFAAQRANPDDEEAWDDVGALDGLDVGDVLD